MMRRELDRQEKRELIQPIGMQNMIDQLDMANHVKEALCHELALRTDELAEAKLEYAQVQAEREEGILRLRKSEEKSRRLRCLPPDRTAELACPH